MIEESTQITYIVTIIRLLAAFALYMMVHIFCFEEGAIPDFLWERHMIRKGYIRVGKMNFKDPFTWSSSMLIHTRENSGLPETDDKLYEEYINGKKGRFVYIDKRGFNVSIAAYWAMFILTGISIIKYSTSITGVFLLLTCIPLGIALYKYYIEEPEVEEIEQAKRPKGDGILSIIESSNGRDRREEYERRYYRGRR